MSSLGQIIRAIQHDAAALPTSELRDEIEVSLDVLDATISQFHRARPGIGAWMSGSPPPATSWSPP